jgi:hypothetical protein
MPISINITAIIAALALIGMVAVPLVTIPLQQQQQQAYAAPAQTVTTVLEIPLLEGSFIFVPCAASGAGEEVDLTGTGHGIIHFTLDGAGGGHFNAQINYQGVSGTGSTTGDKYQATGASQRITEVNAKVGVEFTANMIGHFIGQGNAPNFLLHGLFHFTANADGTITAFVNNERVECK